MPVSNHKKQRKEPEMTALEANPEPGELEHEPATRGEQEQSGDSVLILHAGEERFLFDLDLARRREAQRRLAVLGVYAEGKVDKKHLRAHAQRHYLPEQVLVAWKHQFHLGGLEALLPDDWHPLSTRSQQRVVKRITQLSTLKERLDRGEEITALDLAQITHEQQWDSSRRAERLVRRYQIDGIWGLAPERDPERSNRKREPAPPPDLGAATREAQDLAEERRVLIAPYLSRKRIPNAELLTYAQAHGVSLETMRKYLRDYRANGLRGLLPRERRDKGHCHTLSSRMENVVAGVRLSQRELPLHAVHRQSCQRARLLGEPEPTLWQVRQICDHLSEHVKEIADERYGDERSAHRMTYRYYFDGSVIVYQIDFTPVDVLLKDARKRSLRTQSGETRAFLITCVECSSRLVMSYLFTYDTPNSANIATVLHDALMVSENKPYGGIPDAVWVDKGKQLISKQMQQIARDLKFDLHEGRPNFPEDRGDPQKRGRVERPFRTFNTRLWSTLPGYTHSNTKERHPDVHGELTISELAGKFAAFLKQYHQEVHSETKQTPLAFWAQHCHPRQATPRDLVLLLQPMEHRTVSKGIIQYGGRRYWHDDLWEVPADAVVEIRAQPTYMRPDEIQVIYDGHWICTAFAIDSEAGRQVDGKRVLTAQRRQRRAIQQTINEKRAVLRSTDREIEEQKQQRQQKTSADAPEGQEQQEQHQTRHRTNQKSHSKARATRQSTTTPVVFPSVSKSRTTVWERVLTAYEQHEQNRRTP
jgi:putative transposase